MRIILKEIFTASLTTYFIFFLTENYKKGFVSDFFDINILLAIFFISGIFLFSLGGESE